MGGKKWILWVAPVCIFLSASMQTVSAAPDEGVQRNPQSKNDYQLYVDGAVRNTITKRQGDIQVCYKEFLKRKPKAIKTDGRVSVDWQVTGTGSVVSPEIILNELEDKGLGQCMIRKIKAWKFPDPPTERKVYVDHHFNFKKE